MYKLYFKKAEAPEIKLPISVGSYKKQGNFRETSTSASLTKLKLLTVWITTHCGKFLKRWEYQTTLLASWETCAVNKQQLNWTWNNRLIPNCERSTSRLYTVTLIIYNLYAEYIMWNGRLDESQAGIKTARRNINNFKYADDTTPLAESEKELKSLLMKVKEERKKLA